MDQWIINNKTEETEASQKFLIYAEINENLNEKIKK